MHFPIFVEDDLKFNVYFLILKDKAYLSSQAMQAASKILKMYSLYYLWAALSRIIHVRMILHVTHCTCTHDTHYKAD